MELCTAFSDPGLLQGVPRTQHHHLVECPPMLQTYVKAIRLQACHHPHRLDERLARAASMFPCAMGQLRRLSQQQAPAEVAAPTSNTTAAQAATVPDGPLPLALVHHLCLPRRSSWLPHARKASAQTRRSYRRRIRVVRQHPTKMRRRSRQRGVATAMTFSATSTGCKQKSMRYGNASARFEEPLRPRPYRKRT